MYNIGMMTQPTRAMWWAEMAVFLTAAAATLTAIAILGSLAAVGRHVTLDAVSIALSVGVGIFVSSRFRAWGLRRRATCHTQS
ncbi:hypothetical protein ACFC08_33080 [Streptomyces sp. NPDC056112]|uniref:hypothetical protein n=1 Tax=Streptomyces sp. NPDC056112 TaxID=3345715 RepID=UPI0035DFD65D